MANLEPHPEYSGPTHTRDPTQNVVAPPTLETPPTVFIEQHFTVEEVSLLFLALQLVDATVDELAKVLEVEQFPQKLLHVGPGLQEPGVCVCVCVCVCMCVCVCACE